MQVNSHGRYNGEEVKGRKSSEPSQWIGVDLIGDNSQWEKEEEETSEDVKLHRHIKSSSGSHSFISSQRRTKHFFSRRACMPSLLHRDMVLGQGWGKQSLTGLPSCCWEFGPCAVHPGMPWVELVLVASPLRLLDRAPLLKIGTREEKTINNW